MDCGGKRSATPLFEPELTTESRRSSESAVAACALPAQSKTSPVWRNLKIIRHFHLIRFETVNGFDLSRCRCPFKPAGRAPRVLIRNRHEAVFHRILMDIIQPCQIRLFKGQPRFSVVVPDFAGRRIVEFVDPLGGFLVQKAEHLRQIFCRVFVRRRMANEVVVVGEDGPCFQTPAGIGSDFQQTTMQYRQSGLALKMMLAQVGACRDKIGPANAKTMFWRVRPRDFVGRHNGKLTILDCGGKRSATPLFGRGTITERRLSSESAVAATLCRRSP